MVIYWTSWFPNNDLVSLFFFFLQSQLQIVAALQGSSAYQPLVPGEDDGVEHGLVEKAVAHPLRDDDVHFVDGKLRLLHLAFKDGDHCNTQIHRLNMKMGDWSAIVVVGCCKKLFIFSLCYLNKKARMKLPKAFLTFQTALFYVVLIRSTVGNFCDFRN